MSQSGHFKIKSVLEVLEVLNSLDLLCVDLNKLVLDYVATNIFPITAAELTPDIITKLTDAKNMATNRDDNKKYLNKFFSIPQNLLMQHWQNIL